VLAWCCQPDRRFFTYGRVATLRQLPANRCTLSLTVATSFGNQKSLNFSSKFVPTLLRLTPAPDWRRSDYGRPGSGRCSRSSVSGLPARDSRRNSTPRRAARSRARHATAVSCRPCRRHQAGVLEGSLVAVRDASAGYARELGLLRQQMTGAVVPRRSGRKGGAVTVPARKQSRATRKAASAKKPG
jgi:hypothetical protein